MAIDSLQITKDHFDGKVFFNPTLPGLQPPGLRDVVKMLATDKRTAWPKSVLNTAQPNLSHDLTNGRVALTFINHATFLIQVEGLNILTDPVWSKRASPISFAGPVRVREPGVALADLPKIDLILISHNHYDHLDVATLKKLAKSDAPIVICAKGDRELVLQQGFSQVYEMDWWESIRVPLKTGNSSVRFAEITYAPTQHFSARSLNDRCRSLWGAFIVDVHGRKTYFGGDAGYSTHFKETTRRHGPMDIALLGIGAYKPKWFMTSMHMDPEDAVLAHLDLQAKQSVGMHFGTFQLSSEGITEPVSDLKLALEKHRISLNQFITMGEGETRCF